MSKKKLTEDQLYQNYINEGDTGGLSGIRSTITGSPVETIGTIPEFTRSQKLTNALNQQQAGIQKVSDIYGITDFGESSYDIDIESASGLNDLEDTRANIQPFIDKLGAGIGTFAGKTVTATIGGLGTLFYGVPNAIVEGRLASIFDNDFNKALEKANESIDDTFKVYASEAERNGSFWDQSLGSAHWWTKSLLGDGMSFTAGAILSAYAMGGVGGLISKAANSLKLSSAAFTGAESINALRTAVKIDQAIGGITKTIGMGTKLAVGSMYEGGVEANDFIKQSLDRYKQQYTEQNNGIEPTEEELDEYKLKILPTANTLFAANVALVGASNLAVLPGIFGKGVNETIKSARKNIVTQTIDDVIKPVLKDETLTGFQKATKLAWRAAKPLASEGLMEEGGQNFAKNLALDYVDKHYNPDSAKNTYDMMNSLGNAFNQAYGTIDGWKEIMAGMVIGGFGSPNIKKIGRFEKTEDGKTRWNPLSLDADKSWWTGGIIGEFQTHRENNKRAQELIDNVDTNKLEHAMEYYHANRRDNQGVAGQISDINHMNTLGGVLDEAAALGDFKTAKDAQQDKIFMYLKSRIDAGMFDVIKDEVINPIKSMPIEDYAEQFGYQNISKEELEARRSKQVKQFEESLSDVAKAINFVDSRMSFNLGTEEGRMRRDLNVYAIATSKSVGKRIDQLNEVIKNATAGRVLHKHDDKYFDLIESVPQDKIKKLEDSKKDKSDSEIEKINEQIKSHQDVIDNLNFERRASKEAEKLSESGFDAPPTVIQAKKFADEILKRYKLKNNSVEELELKEQLESALQDLPKLLRRKEEALELYAVAKDPKAFNNFWRTQHFNEVIEKHMNSAAEKIADSQNEEHTEAEKLIDEDEETPPEVIAKKTGAPMSTVTQILDNKNKIKVAKKAKSIKNLLSALNKDLPFEHQFKDENELLEELIDIIEDEDSTDEQVESAEALSNQINQLITEANQPVTKDSDKIPTKEGLVDETDNDRQPSDESDISANINNVDEINKDLRKNDGITETDSDSEKLIDAFNHIAWNNVSYDQSTGQFTYSGIDPNASKLLQDFRKLSIGQKVEFKVNPTAEFPAEDLEHIKIDILINGEVVGYVHTTDYIRPDRVVTKDDNLAINKEELIKLREAIIESSQLDVESQKAEIEKRRQEELFYKGNSLQKESELAKTLSFSDASNEKLWKVLGMFFNSVDEFTSKGEKYIVRQGNSKFYKDIVNSKGEIVITIERQGLEYDIFNTNIELAKDIISSAESKGFIKDEENQINAKYDAELASIKESSSKPFESHIEKVGNGRLITAREFGGKRTDNIPTSDALPDKSLVIMVANNGEIDKNNLPKNSLILNQKGIEQGKGNNFKNGIFALIPVNKVNDNGVEKISYIAAPLSPQTLKPEQSETITNLVEMFLRNQVGIWTNENQAEFDAISKSIGNQTSYRDEMTDQKVDFNPASLTGLRNVIKLFTYDRVSLKDDLGVDGEAKSTKKIFGINKVKDGSIVVSFGTPKNVTSFKIKQNEAGEFQFFTKQVGRSAWEQIESEGFFDDLRNGISGHMGQSFFYHNKSLMRTSNLQVPTVENVDGKLSVKFSTKTYPEFLKDNTQTNLRSVDLGNGNYSYTVQRNIVFATPKVEKIEQPRVEKPIVESQKPNTRKRGIKKGDDVEYILNVYDKREEPFRSSTIKRGIVEALSKDGRAYMLNGRWYNFKDDIFKFLVNHTENSEIKSLKPQQEPEIREKPQQQRRGNGKSIERKKPLSDEDLMPNFNEVAEESVEFKTNPKANTLQMDFITFAKMQEPEIKRSLIAMNRNKEIEVKCK